MVSDVVGKDTLRPTHFGRNRFHTLLLYRTRQNENASADRASGTDESGRSQSGESPFLYQYVSRAAYSVKPDTGSSGRAGGREKQV